MGSESRNLGASKSVQLAYKLTQFLTDIDSCSEITGFQNKQVCIAGETPTYKPIPHHL